MENHSMSTEKLYSPIFSRGPKKGESRFTKVPVVLSLSGLPARGKTYTSRRLSHYFNWIGIKTKVFNVGEYRRKYCGHSDHSFFSDDNENTIHTRMKIALDCLNDALRWLFEEDGAVVIFDATNTTRERRQLISERVESEGCRLFFIELICNDKEIIENNIVETKITSPDYVSMNADEAVSDFKSRIEHYASRWEPIDEVYDKDLSYLKMIDAGLHFVVHRASGYIESRAVYFLMNIRLTPKTIYITRHGESQLNVHGRIGGDSELSERGVKFAKVLGEYFNQNEVEGLHVWTSLYKRTIQTAQFIQCGENFPLEQWKALNEINAGECDKMTYKEIQEKYPEEFRMRDEDKFHYRYPQGESYEDLVARLEPVIMELERQTNVLVICHQAIGRCLLAYFEDWKLHDLPYMKVPLHTLIKITPGAYGNRVEKIPFDVPAVSTHRPRPEVAGAVESDQNGNIDPSGSGNDSSATSYCVNKKTKFY